MDLVVGSGKGMGGGRREREGEGERVCAKTVAKPAVALWPAESSMMDLASQWQGRLCMLTLGFRLEPWIVKLRHSRKLRFNLRYHFVLKVPVVRGEGWEAGFLTNEMILLWLAKTLLKTSEHVSFSLSFFFFQSINYSNC